MSDDVQALVDALAAELHRPTGVDDRHFRSIAYSSHEEEVDRVRLASILRREAPPPVRDWLEDLKVQQAQDPLRVPANPDLGMAARVCVPLRFEDVSLGYLWLIDEPDPLTEEQLREARRYAEEFAVTLYRQRLLERDDRRRERELLGRALGLCEGDGSEAVAALFDEGHLVRASTYAVVVAAAIGLPEAGPEAVRIRLVDATEQVRRAVAPHHLSVLAHGSEVVALLACSLSGEAARRAEMLARAGGMTAVEKEGGVVVGVSDEIAGPSGFAAAYEQAHAACRIAATTRRENQVVRWGELGAYRSLERLLGDRDPGGVLPDSFRRLLESDEAGVLVETLERYLDLGGDARAAADRLFIHRSSLYGRLHRIEQIAGVDLHSGEDRLELHIALRLWRLGGSGLKSKF